MNRDQFNAKRQQFVGKLRERWGALTDDHKLESRGRRDQIAGRISDKCRRVDEEAARQLAEFFDRHLD